MITLHDAIATGYYIGMIKSFACQDTEAMYGGARIAKFVNIETVAMRKLAMLNRAGCLNDLRIPPNNRLEALKGSRKGQWSVRINDQWRLGFIWTGYNAESVEIIDYH